MEFYILVKLKIPNLLKPAVNLQKIMPKTSIVIVIAISLLFFWISAFLLKGSLNDKLALGNEINAPEEALYDYNISKKVPYKHRILFPLVVKTSYAALKSSENSQLFYNIYMFWSAVFYSGAALSFFLLLKVLRFNVLCQWVGLILFLISPAILAAYVYPVHTREDMLGYLLINLCLISIVRNQFWAIFIFSVLGVLCRETLLLFPLIYFLYVDLRKGAYVLGCCLLVFLALRFGMGDNTYKLLELGLFYNLKSIGHAVGFLFLVFSFMWIPFLFDIYKLHSSDPQLPSEPISLFRKSSLLAFSLVLVTTFVGGRFNEIRLMFILFPWVISIFLFYVTANQHLLLNLINSRRFLIYALSGCVFFIVLGIVLNNNLDFFFDDPNLKFPHSQWLLLSCIYFYVCYLCIPLYRAIGRTHFKS